MPELKKANIMEVARKAGVSAMTVTRAFNGGAPVADKTRKQIMSAAEELGYRPNPMARALRGSKSRSIGVLFPMSGPHNSSVFLRRISLEAMEKSYVTYMADSLSDAAVICEALDDFLDRAVDGIICEFPSSFSKDEKIVRRLSAFPVKVIISERKTDVEANQIIRDRRRAIRDAVDCFAGSGRKTPVLIGSMPEDDGKVKVFQGRLEYHGMKAGKNIFVKIDKSATSRIGEIFTDGLRDAYPGKISFDSIWCSCDEGAAAVMDYLRRRGISVPGDVAVAGFNNTEMCEYLNPRLASVKRFDMEVAECAADMLFGQMENRENPLKTKNYAMEFIWRESAGRKF